VNIENEEPSDIWIKINKKIEEFKEKVEESEKEIVNIDIESAKRGLERKGRNGIRAFFNSLKNRNDFYEVIGKNWSTLLKVESKNKLKEIINLINGTEVLQKI